MDLSMRFTYKLPEEIFFKLISGHKFLSYL